MALPRLRGTDHFGFTVPDIEQAHDFFVNVIGCSHIYTLGPFCDDESLWMEQHLNVHPRTVMRELRMYRTGYGSNFEVFQYEPAEPPQPQPSNSDIGGHHIAFYVDDLDEAVEYLHQQGIRVLSGPTTSSGPSVGQRWVYFLSPWGMQFELVSFPHGKAYEEAANVRLWDARYPGK